MGTEINYWDTCEKYINCFCSDYDLAGDATRIAEEGEAQCLGNILGAIKVNNKEMLFEAVDQYKNNYLQKFKAGSGRYGWFAMLIEITEMMKAEPN